LAENDVQGGWTLPEGWEWTTLGEVCLPPQYGWTTKAVEKGNLRLLRTSDITSGSVDWETVPFCREEPADEAKYLLHDGDIVISRAGSVGHSYLVRKPKSAVFASYLIRFKPLVDEQYVAYFAQSPSYWGSVYEERLGIAVPNINATKLKGIRLPLAPLAEQRRIVVEIETQFTRLDAAVTALERAQANLRRYKAAVLKAACEGRLVPTEASLARAEGRDYEPADQLLARILAERRARWEADYLEKQRAKGKEPKDDKWKQKYKGPALLDTEGLPELPEGWVWAVLEGISEAVGGYAFRSKDYTEDGFQILKIGNVKMGQLDLSSRPVFIRDVDDKIAEKYLLKAGDIVITLTGTRKKRDYGYVALVRNEKNLLLNQRVARLRFSSALYPSYFLIALQSETVRDNFFKYETGNVGQGNVSMRAITKEVVPLPPLAEQRRIVAEVERRLSVLAVLEASVGAALARAGRLRQAVLKQAFEGRLVPQDPDDEPASVLLERIRTQRKTQITEEGKRNTRQMLLPSMS
jgi:type I restriction enzyme S subunit